MDIEEIAEVHMLFYVYRKYCLFIVIKTPSHYIAYFKVDMR